MLNWAQRIGPQTAQLFDRILADKPHPEMGYRGCVTGPESGRTFVTFLRSRRQGAFSPQECSFLERLMPHLRSALHLHRLLRSAETTHSCAESLRAGIVIVSTSGAILEMNQAFRRMMAANDGLRVTAKGHLELLKGGVGSWRRCVTSADWTSCAEAEQSFAMLADPPSGMRSYIVRRTPVRDSFASIVLGDRAAAIFEIIDPEQAPRNLEDTLQQLYALTPGEARFATVFAEEGDMKRTCGQLSIQITTGRSHLQKIFLKMGIRRQAQLGLLVARL
jgi:hypothetical protein